MLLFRSERILGASRPFWVWALATICVLVALLPIMWAWWFHGGERYDWLRGSSAWGIFFGSVGGWLIIFEMLYWVRKKWRGFPSNYLTRENVSGWPVGSKPGGLRFAIHLQLGSDWRLPSRDPIRCDHQENPEQHLQRVRSCHLLQLERCK